MRVPDTRISQVHAELSLSGNQLELRRTHGQRPVEIDGKPVLRCELSAGSRFSIGETEFTIVARRDGMELIDARSILGPIPTPLQPANAARTPENLEAVGPRSKPERLLGQLLGLLTSAQDKSTLVQAVLDLACRRLMASRALLGRVAEDGRIEVIASRGFDEGAEVNRLISTTVLNQIVEERQAVIIGDTAATPGGLALQKSVVINHICAVACTPVFDLQGRLVKILYVDNQTRAAVFSTQDVELLIWLGEVYNLLEDNLEMRRRLEAEVVELKRVASSGAQIVAESREMLEILERARRAAASEASVLILGESGTGKECVARMLHQQSPRAGGPFVARNCAAIPLHLFESEMFGHLRGAFTGADRDRPGAFEEARGGTLFLDEIGELDPAHQTKLLRAIQERCVRPVGGSRDVPVDVRVVCATNRDLREGFRTRAFREDLYYRIATVSLHVPSLRQRPADILPLARHYVRLLSGGTRTLAPAAEERLLGYPWPGNVRELRSVVEQAVIFAAGSEIQPDELDLPEKATGIIQLGDRSLASVERRHILNVLDSVQGNKSEAAKVLGLARSTLNLKLKTYAPD